MEGYSTLDKGTKDVQPIQLKDGTTLTPKDKASEAKFRADHPELIAQ